jgi:predicted glycoside hydrolase/deacetylase ChbG (UPF0249 family)
MYIDRLGHLLIMLLPHYRFDWLLGFLGHIRFLAAVINPFSIGRVTSSPMQDTDTAVLSNDPLSSSRGESIVVETKPPVPTGTLIINADDWGRDRQNTDRIRDCVLFRTVSSASAMVFMEDSERAAEIAREHGFDTGLHLNFTSAFSMPGCPSQLLEHQCKISTHLLRHRYAKVVFHPGLARSFEYVVSAQLDEYRRLYGAEPNRLDGHHHMHLCANVLFGKLIPEGIIVRRNFSFVLGEKSSANRRYREVEDRMLAKRHRCVDFFFSLVPFEPKGRLDRVFSMARKHVVEVETHPVKREEHQFLMSDEIFRWTGDLSISPRFAIAR